MDELMALLQGDRDPGLYRLEPTVAPEQAAALCQEHGCQLFYIDGSTIASKSSFLQQVAQVMEFPDYFGQNWDAFEDCLTDLDWFSADCYVILYDHPEAFAQGDPVEWATALDILRSTVEYWRETASPLYVLFQGKGSQSIAVETI
jgi:hypothetical protein